MTQADRYEGSAGFERVGGPRAIPVGGRVVPATNRDLRAFSSKDAPVGFENVPMALDEGPTLGGCEPSADRGKESSAVLLDSGHNSTAFRREGDIHDALVSS
jgi:hypothetical protein